MPDEQYRFEVALSFAGDNKRELVRKIAQSLEDRLGKGRVFFDEWFEAELAGPDAHIVLQQYYGRRSRLVVTCVCKRYNEKPWTQDEWRAIQAFERELRDAGTDNIKRMRFLPLRFGDGDIDALFSTAIVPDVRNRSTKEIADLILERLEHSKKGIEQVNTTNCEFSEPDIASADRQPKSSRGNVLHNELRQTPNLLTVRKQGYFDFWFGNKVAQIKVELMTESPGFSGQILNAVRRMTHDVEISGLEGKLRQSSVVMNLDIVPALTVRRMASNGVFCNYGVTDVHFHVPSSRYNEFRQQAICQALPVLIENLLYQLNQGSSLAPAIAKTANEISLVHPEFAEVLQKAVFSFNAGKPISQAIGTVALECEVDEFKDLARKITLALSRGSNLKSVLQEFGLDLRRSIPIQ